MANKFHKYDDLLDESGSYRAAAEKALIRSFYGYEKDLLDYLYSKFYSFKVETRFKNQLHLNCMKYMVKRSDYISGVSMRL